MIGGPLLAGFGGYLQLWNWTVTPATAGGTAQPPTPGTATQLNYRYLDVANWQLVSSRIAPKLWHSGMVGAIKRRLVANDWVVKANIWYDFTNPVDIQLYNGNTLAVKLVMGYEESWTGSPLSNGIKFNPSKTVANDPLPGFGLPANGLGTLASGADFIPCYAAPIAIWSENHVIDSSEGDDMVRMEVTLEGSSLMWYLNTPEDENRYNNYVTEITYQMADA